MKRKSFKCSWIKNQLAPLWHSSSICTWWSTIVSIFSLFLASHFCLTILCEHEHWTLQYNKTGRSLECTRFIIHINVFKTNGVTFRITEFGFNQITTNIKLYISKETDTLFLDVSLLTLNVLCFCSFYWILVNSILGKTSLRLYVLSNIPFGKCLFNSTAKNIWERQERNNTNMVPRFFSRIPKLEEINTSYALSWSLAHHLKHIL